MTTELKAKINDLEKIQSTLKKIGVKFVSEVEVTDIYFKSKEKTNLKISIYPEDSMPFSGSYLIFYEHDPISKKFEFKKMEVEKVDTLKYILGKVIGVKTAIDKRRKFFRFNSIMISIDKIKELGGFLILQGENKKELLKLLDEFGIDRNSLEKKSFDELVSKTKKA